MGSDIHYVIERKNDKYGWIGVFATDCALTTSFEQMHHYAPYSYRNRNYRFFGLLAGVRSEEGPDPLGLPEDMSALTAACAESWGYDGHSHSYCSLKDFVAAHIDANLEVSERAANKLQNIDLTKEALGKMLWADDENYRVVFWFDS